MNIENVTRIIGAQSSTADGARKAAATVLARLMAERSQAIPLRHKEWSEGGKHFFQISVNDEVSA